MGYPGHLKAGEKIGDFTMNNGLQGVVRAPRMEDLDKFLEFINGLVAEDTYIYSNKHFNRDREAEWLSNQLMLLEKGELLHIIATLEDEIAGSLYIIRQKEKETHIGVLGIGVIKKYRGLGIGGSLMKNAFLRSKRMGIRSILLETFALNKKAIGLYSSVGFKKVGLIKEKAYHKNKYQDILLMQKKL